MASIGVAQLGSLPPAEIAARSRAVLDRTLEHDAELALARPSSDAVLLGAFQRGAEVDGAYPLYRRGSGGAAVRVGEGTLWVSLALARPAALVACEAVTLVNRYVRPLLRVITKLGAHARYFGRDWISVAQRPAALVAFAHDAATGRAAFEAFVAVATPFALGPRAAFMGKAPTTLEELLEKPVDVNALARAIEAAYAAAYARDVVHLDDVSADPSEEDPRAEPPWAATKGEAIGIVAAGRAASGRLRIGGELLASRDAIAALEARANDLRPDASAKGVELAVTETLAAPGVAIDGVRALASVADVVARALRAPP